jgi:hypothetical protein
VSRVAPVAAALFVLVLPACGGGDGENSAGETTTVVTTVTGPASTTTAGKHDYPPVVVDNFMKSCTDGLQNRRAYCACTLEELAKDVSVQDFARIGLAGGKLSPRIQRVIQAAAVACVDKIPS